MQFDSFAAFVAMGGHGLYVWLAYGATLAVLLFSTIGLHLARRKQLTQLRWAATEQGGNPPQAAKQQSTEQQGKEQQGREQQGKNEHESET